MANFNIAVLNSVVLPTPTENGITIGYQKIWSKNTGRGSTGLMVGDIVAIKRTVNIKWDTLSTADYNTIHNIVDVAANAFIPLVLKRYSTDTGESMTVYSADTSYPLSYISKDGAFYKDVTLSLVEQ